MFVLMDTWRVGRRVHLEKMRDNSLALDLFLDRADKYSQRVSGTAVFLSPRSDVAPNALLHSLKHYKVLHERVVLATVTVADTPFVPPSRRVAVEKLGKGFFSVRFVYGFFEIPDIPEAFAAARAHGLALDMDSVDLLPGPRNPGAGRTSQPAALAGGALHVAGVERASRRRASIICRRGAWSSSARKSRFSPARKPAPSDRRFPAASDAPDDPGPRPRCGSGWRCGRRA